MQGEFRVVGDDRSIHVNVSMYAGRVSRGG